MWSYLASSVLKTSNYSVINIDNVYKFHIITMETLNEEQKKKFVENMKLQMGMSFYDEFKMYLFRKLPNSDLIQYFN